MGWVQVAIAAVGVISSLVGGKKASDAAGDQASKERTAERKVTDNKLLDLNKQEEILRGQTLAAAAGSNVVTNVGSPLQILNEQAAEFDRERFITSQVGATKAAAAGTRGRMVANQAIYGGISQAAGHAANAFSIMANMKAGNG